MDFQILYAINKLHNDILDKIMITITSLVNSGFIWILISIILIFIKKTRKCGILILISMFIGLVIGNGILKNIIARDRPCWIDKSIKLLIESPKDYSFPSGHTMVSFEAAVMIWLHNKKLGIIPIGFATFVAFSRMYLFVHFPTDIIAGMILGISISLGVYFVDKRYNNKRNLIT